MEKIEEIIESMNKMFPHKAPHHIVIMCDSDFRDCQHRKAKFRRVEK